MFGRWLRQRTRDDLAVDMDDSRGREKGLGKKWVRRWKLELTSEGDLGCCQESKLGLMRAQRKKGLAAEAGGTGGGCCAKAGCKMQGA